MRIGLVDSRSPDSRADGAAIYVAQLAPALAQEHRVSIVTVRPGALYLLQAIRAIRRLITNDRPDIVHLNNLSDLTLSAVMWLVEDRFPIALSVHDYRLVDRWRAIHRSLTGRVGLVISPSNYALDRHLRYGFFTNAIKLVLPYGIDTPEAESLLEPPSLDSSSPLLGTPGSGYFIFRSNWPEPFPVAIQEAFRAGKVVIASRVGGVPEMIRDAVNGLLVEPADEASIAVAAKRLDESPELAARLRASALETARLYDMRFHVARLTDAYRQLITAERVGDFDHRAA